MVVLLMCIYFATQQPRFASWSNLSNVARQFALSAVFAFAQTFAVVGGGFDISIGSQVGAASVIMAMATKAGGLGLGLPAAIFATGLLGLINGVTIARFGVSPFVVTLGMLSGARGLALYVSKGVPIYGFSGSFKFLGEGHIGPLSMPFIIAVAVFLVGWFLLNQTTFGRYLYAIGGNEEAARLSGVPVARVKILSYVICGLITGVGATVLTSRVDSGQPNLGTGLELEAIAAVIIGGVALGGGEGKLGGVVWGVLVISLLSNGHGNRGSHNFRCTQEEIEGNLNSIFNLGTDWNRMD
jgi:ribose/xylose/arabinose/galactoside ABC-type transport system permease subunit